MIYKFRGSDSLGEFEIQLRAPAGENIRFAAIALGRAFHAQGWSTGPLRYVGSIDSDHDGLIIKENDDPNMRFILANAANATSEESIKCTLHGWYVPGEAAPARGKCAVKGCEQEAAFNLCTEHAAPGVIVTVGSANKQVIVYFLIETERGVHLFSIDDHFLGLEFGGPAGLKNRLTNSGYKVLRIVSDEADMDAVKKARPDLQIVESGYWFRDLVEREARPRARGQAGA